MINLTDVNASENNLGTGLKCFDLSVAVEAGQFPILVEGNHVALA